MPAHRLYRCRHDRQLAGVASGVAEYLDVDPTVVRILWILSVFLGGFSILVYVIMALVVPLEPAATAASLPTDDTPVAWPAVAPADGAGSPTGRIAGDDRGARTGLVVGMFLVIVGAVALANALVPGWMIGWLTWPVLLVALGVALVVGALRRPVER